MSSDIISLIDFWRIQRSQQGLPCIIRPCHRVKARALTNLVLGNLTKPNLMILEPPRIGKTDLGVKAFIPWSQSYFPDSEYIVAGYAADLAEANSVHIRTTLGQRWYQEISDHEFGAHTKFIGDKPGGRQDYFHTLEGGSVKAVGVGGGITGFGAGKLRPEFGGCILIDDPLKAQDATSPAKRKACIEWYHGTLESRRNRREAPKTPIVLIMQRLHPQDLAGHLLQTERDQWTVVQIPAEQNGESIWPERISLEELHAMKEANPEIYWAQYQQEPTQGVHAIFKDGWWRRWTDRKAVERQITLKIITADTAFKDSESADWTVFQCWGLLGTSGMALIDQVRGKYEFPELVANAKAFVDKHTARQTGITPATEFWIEDKASGTSLVQTLRREGVMAKPWAPSTKTAAGKVARAKQCTMPISAGRVYLPDPKMPGYAWVDGFINEHAAFSHDDSHLSDDQCDAQTMATLVWMERGGGVGPLPEIK